MTPYYQHKDVTIYHANAADIVPVVGAVLLTVTDPPYGIDRGKGRGRIRGKAEYGGGWEDTPSYVSDTVVPIVKNCIKISDRTIVTPGIRCLMKYPEPTDIGCFWQPAATGWGPWGFITSNPILYYGKDPRVRSGPWPSGRVMNEKPSTKDHPCAKPIKAWKWLVHKGIGDDKGTVLDPFAGSGTTLVAAKELGVSAIGIEIDERYCEIAAKRLAQEMLEF